MRLLYAVLCILALAGCSSGPASAPVPTAALATPQLPTTVALPAVMAAPEQWSGRSITLIAPVAPTSERRVLVPGFGVDGAPLAIEDGKRSLWLAQPLDAALAQKLGDGPAVLKLRGQLSPPGAYGSDGRFPYQFSADTVGVVQPERTTIANLAENAQALDGVLLEVTCYILANKDGILLVDELSAGGVPSAQARQIKLRDVPDRRLLSRLQHSGDVRYGAVTIMGWWSGGAMTPFMVEPSS